MHKPLFILLAIAFLVRIAGVAYGLPFWVVDDEPPFILAALKMLELKTVLPILHLEAFQSVLYYPPYMSYLFLVPFALFAGIKFFLFSGASSLFPTYLLSDLSGFFVIARLITIAMSVGSIYFIYRIGERLFNDRLPALSASFFASTSLIHVALSMTGRHWMSVFFFSTLVLYFLSRDDYKDTKRYSLAALAAGIGVGFAVVNVFSAIFIALWFFFYERKKFSEAIRSKLYVGITFLFAALALLPVLLYPKGLGFAADTTGGTGKNILEAILSPVLFAKTLAVSEPILLLFAFLGMFFLWKNFRSVFLTFGIYVYLYSLIFYLAFRFEPRFLLGILPIFFLLAGYGFVALYEKIKWSVVRITLGLILIVPLVLVLRLDYLAFKGDSRVLALSWANRSLPEDSRVLIFSRLTSFPSTPEAVAEQELLDPSSVRKVQRAQAEMSAVGNKRMLHALNLADVSNDSFYEKLDSYAEEHGYEYLVIQPTYRGVGSFESLMKKGELLVSFDGAPKQTTECMACGNAPTSLSIAESQFIVNPFELFKIRELGPPIEIYKIR